MLLVHEVWGSNLELIKSPTCCHHCNLKTWARHKAVEMALSFVTPERLLSEYNEDLIVYKAK